MSTSFDAELDRFSDALWLEDGLAPRSLESYRRDLTQLFTWLEPQGIPPDQAQRGDIELFLAHRSLDESIAARSLARQLTAIKRYQRWLLREGRRDDDPTLTVAAPRLPKPLPKTLSENDVEALINAPDVNTPHGLRDRVGTAEHDPPPSEQAEFVNAAVPTEFLGPLGHHVGDLVRVHQG